MKRIVAPCLATVAAAGAMAFAFHNVAAADCLGAEALRVCYTPNPGWTPSVDPTGSSIDECIHTGPTCQPVSVPFPAVSPGSGLPASNIRCYQGYSDCIDPR